MQMKKIQSMVFGNKQLLLMAKGQWEVYFSKAVCNLKEESLLPKSFVIFSKPTDFPTINMEQV